MSQSSSPGVSAVVQGTIREMQAFVTRTLQSVRGAIQHAGPYQQVVDVIQRLNHWVQRASPPAPEDESVQPTESQFGISQIEVPAWWRLLEQFEGAYEQWAESLPHNWRNLAMPELEAVARTMESTGWVLAWVPREDVLRELIDAQDRRDAIGRLLTHQDHVLDDLKKELGEVTDASLTDPSVALHQGVRSYEWGHAFPAQAIAAVVLTSLIGQQLEANDVERSPLLSFRRNSLLWHRAQQLLAAPGGSRPVTVQPLRDGAPIRPHPLQPDERPRRLDARRQLPARSPGSHRGELLTSQFASTGRRWRRWDSNPRPPACKAGALAS